MAPKSEMEMHSTGNESACTNARKPHFCKIIVSPIIQLKKLRIPAAFVKRFGNSLLDCASLRAPEGAVWKVDMSKRKGGVWFDQGWQDFAKHYSLAFGHFLVFKYHGNSKFEVAIFDKTCTEIEYPNGAMPTGKSSNENQQTLERAKAYECSNPHFIIVVRLSYVSPRFLANIPAAYAAKHMKKEKNYTIRLQTEIESKTWPAKCHLREGDRSVTIGAGWKDFVGDNGLEVGDACLFELTHGGTKTYRVHIFRTGQ